MAFDASQFMSPTGGDYEITNSLRFNDDSAEQLTRTFSSAGNRKTFTYSVWLKRGNTSDNSSSQYDYQNILDTNGNNYISFSGDNKDCIRIFANDGSTRLNLVTTQVFRDHSSWYHIMFVLDTTQGTAANRAKLYVNGVQVTSFSAATYPDQNYDLVWSSAVSHSIGGTDANYFDGYLAEVNFIDGAAKAPADFGETGDYGEWKPIQYSGSYGDEGFYLDFKSSGVGTAGSSTIGADRSGNTNHWTSTNIAVTDQMLDSPTNNFATLNPLYLGSRIAPLSEGNLLATFGSGFVGAFSTILCSSGKWYAEVLITRDAGNRVGVWKESAEGLANPQNSALTFNYFRNGQQSNGTTKSSYGDSYTAGDIIGIELDQTNNTINFYKNNSAQGQIDLSSKVTGTNPVFLGGAGRNDTQVWNFGQDSSFAGNKTAQGNQDGNAIGDFFYAPPSGFLALCTANLPEPAVKPSEHFNTVLYTGNDNDNHAITGVGFQPDWIWIKNRGTTDVHELVDAVRGQFSGGNGLGRLRSNDTTVEIDSTIEGFTSDGFTLDGDNTGYNGDGGNYVAWNWKANGSGSSNTTGSINSTVSVNTDAGFSIVSYTGNVTAGATVGHGLSSAPEIIITKSRAGTTGWLVGHSAIGFTKNLVLDTTASVNTETAIWNDTAPTSTVFSLGSDTFGNSANTRIAYAFHSVDGYSKVGSYKGNSNADGTFVYTGFRPAFILLKAHNSAEPWAILDTARDINNEAGTYLTPNSSAVEGTGYKMDFLSNGFKLRGNIGAINTDGYIYLAFAEMPFSHSNAK